MEILFYISTFLILLAIAGALANFIERFENDNG
jgi:hypothetical protein